MIRRRHFAALCFKRVWLLGAALYVLLGAYTAVASDGDLAPSDPNAGSGGPVSNGTPPSASAIANGDQNKLRRVSDQTTLVEAKASHAKLLEHFLGATSRSIRFDWRGSPVQLGVYVGELIERNNYASYRGGLILRKAFGEALLEVLFSGVYTAPTLSSELLALTPYQQSGRPARLEFGLNGGYPIAEGVVTPNFSWVPPAQLVWMAYGGMTYALYPTLVGKHWQNLWRPNITDDERVDLAPVTLGGMHVDAARFQVMVGTSLDVYFVPGIFVTPRVMMAIPLGFSLLTGSELGFWWEWGMAIGYAF